VSKCDHAKAGNIPRGGVWVGEHFGTVCFVSKREDSTRDLSVD